MTPPATTNPDTSRSYLIDTPAMLPTAFILGPPKAASTFLWQCAMQGFHPTVVCGGDSFGHWSDAKCGDKRFLLSGISYVSWWGACFTMRKEGTTPWSSLRDVSRMRWHVWGGPTLSLKYWQFREPKRCRLRNHTAFAELVEDACMNSASPCPLHERPRSFLEPTKPQCLQTCDTCELHPGVDSFNRSSRHHLGAMSRAAHTTTNHACRGRTYQCESKVCHSDGAVSNRLTMGRVSYASTHLRHFSVDTAWPHLGALKDANISAHRVLTLEANPGVFAGGGVGDALPMAAGLSTAGMLRMRFIVGYRSPLSLLLSTFAFYQGNYAKIAEYMAYSVARVAACEALVHTTPETLLELPAPEWRLYRACMLRVAQSTRPASYGAKRNHVPITLYAVHLSHWLRAGFRGPQFLIVPMRVVGANGTGLHSALGAFLGLPVQAAPAPGSGPPDAHRVDSSTSRHVHRSCAQPANTHRSADDARISRATNKTAAQLRTEFLASPQGEALRSYLDRHDALLPPLVVREGIQVHGGVAALRSLAT